MEGASIHYPALESSQPDVSEASPRLLETKVGYALYHANARQPLVRIVPDDRWLGMWRMLWPDGYPTWPISRGSRTRRQWIFEPKKSNVTLGKDRLRFHWRRSNV